MDLVLDGFDHYLGDTLYSYIPLSTSTACTGVSSSALLTTICEKVLPALPPARDALARQTLSLFALGYLGIFFLYFSFAIPAYLFLFDHRMMQHPKFLPHQIRQEIKLSLDSFVPNLVLFLPWFLADVRGYAKLYDTLDAGPFGASEIGAWTYLVGSAGAFLLSTDYAIYWIHRTLHHPLIYKHVHKAHHRFIIPTPFASHAFHPFDGFITGLPYHLFVFVVPVHKVLFLCLFLLVNIWTIVIHDSDMIVDSVFENYILGPSHHTLHHLYFTKNYGQYFTWADKAFDTYRLPAKFENPLNAVFAVQEKKASTSRGLSDIEESDSETNSLRSHSPSPYLSDSVESSGSSDSGFEEGEGASLSSCSSAGEEEETGVKPRRTFATSTTSS